jgi:hypothetical protein
MAEQAARPNHTRHLGERPLDRLDVLERRARDEQVETGIREAHPGRVHGDEPDRSPLERAVDAIRHAGLLEDEARQTPSPLAAVAPLAQREVEVDPHDLLDGLKPEQHAVDAGATAHL